MPVYVKSVAAKWHWLRYPSEYLYVKFVAAKCTGSGIPPGTCILNLWQQSGTGSGIPPSTCMLNLWQQSGTGSGIPPSTQFSPACCRLIFICTMFALLQRPSLRYVTGPTQSWTNVWWILCRAWDHISWQVNNFFYKYFTRSCFCSCH
jgi:hypothetical protein